MDWFKFEKGVRQGCILSLCLFNLGLPDGSDGKEFACQAGDAGSIPRLGRSAGEGNGNSLRYFTWEISWTESLVGYSPWVTKSWTWLKWQHTCIAFNGLSLVNNSGAGSDYRLVWLQAVLCCDNTYTLKPSVFEYNKRLFLAHTNPLWVRWFSKGSVLKWQLSVPGYFYLVSLSSQTWLSDFPSKGKWQHWVFTSNMTYALPT